MANEAQEVKNSGGGKGLIIVLIALVVILLLAVIGGGYFLYSQGALGGAAPQPAQAEVKTESSAKGEFKADIEDLVLNLTDSRGKEKLMKLSFSIKSSSENIAAIVEEYKPEIIDVVISQISSRSSEELLTVGGKNLLRDELLNDINNAINTAAPEEKIARNSVKAIFFTTLFIK